MTITSVQERVSWRQLVAVVPGMKDVWELNAETRTEHVTPPDGKAKV